MEHPDPPRSWPQHLAASLGEHSSHLYYIVTAVTVYDVAARYLFAAPTIWALELSLLLCGTQYILACAAGSADRSFIRIDALYRRMASGRRNLADWVAFACALAFLSALLWAGWQQAASALSVGERSGSVWNSPSPTVLKVMIVIGAVLMLLVELSFIYRRLRRHDAPLR